MISLFLSLSIAINSTFVYQRASHFLGGMFIQFFDLKRSQFSVEKIVLAFKDIFLFNSLYIITDPFEGFSIYFILSTVV
jgi:hypothetical protein